MNNQSSKLSLGIAITFEIILIVTAILNIAARRWKDLGLSLLAIVCMTFPFIITRNANLKNIELPSSFQAITLVFIFLAQYLGEIRNFYLIFWWWDLLLHAIFGSYAVIVALFLIRGTFIKRQAISKKQFTLFTIIFAFSNAIALGTIWEMFEFIGDYLFKTNMVKGGLEDILIDLLVKMSTAFLTSIIYYISGLKQKNADYKDIEQELL